MKIFIIGSGNIAFHLTKAFVKNKVEIAGLYSRNEFEGQKIAKLALANYHHQLQDIPETADIYLICVSDDAIKEVSKNLTKNIKESKIVAHTSGSKSMKASLPNCNYGGVFYPLQTFTKGKRMSYWNIPICVNGVSEKVIMELTNLGNQISQSVQTVSDKQRKNIHLSAVVINNFVNHLIFNAQQFLEDNEIDPKILQPLLEETIKKQKTLGAFNAQTGPARRSDTETLDAHIGLLKSHKQLKNIYISISKSIQKTYKKK